MKSEYMFLTLQKIHPHQFLANGSSCKGRRDELVLERRRQKWSELRVTVACCKTENGTADMHVSLASWS